MLAIKHGLWYITTVAITRWSSVTDVLRTSGFKRRYRNERNH